MRPAAGHCADGADRAAAAQAATSAAPASEPATDERRLVPAPRGSLPANTTSALRRLHYVTPSARDFDTY